MKNMKKLIGILLALLLVFSSVGVYSAASSAERTADTTVYALSEDETESEASGLTAFFEELIAKIKKAVLILVGKISIMLDGKYSDADYADFSSDAFEIPGLDDGFVPQGICFSESLDSFVISGYAKNENSRLYLIDKESGEAKKLILKDFTKHAGGVAAEGDDVWVCAGGDESKGGYVYHISAAVLNNASDGDEIEFDGSFQTQVRASALCCDGDRLYVAEFYEKSDYPVNPEHSFADNKAWAVGYNLPVDISDYDGSEKTPDIILSVPEKVQGMAVTSEGNIIFSTSYGRFYDSTLHIYRSPDEWTQDSKLIGTETVTVYIADDKGLISKVKMPTLMEGTDIHGDVLYAVFESGAEAYSDAKEINTSVKAVNINNLIDAL